MLKSVVVKCSILRRRLLRAKWILWTRSKQREGMKIRANTMSTQDSYGERLKGVEMDMEKRVLKSYLFYSSRRIEDQQVHILRSTYRSGIVS